MRVKATMWRRRGGQRGYVQILLLILVILGISMWGVSELTGRVADSVADTDARTKTALEDAKRALINYALLPPPATGAGSVDERFNVWTPTLQVPYRRFSLPCPDVGDDGDLNGVSDIVDRACAIATTYPLAVGSRFGRLPWQTFSGDAGGGYQFIRGVDDRDFRDGYNYRLWYIVSQNVVDRADGEPLNANALRRQTDGWISIYNEDGRLLSDRVAAVVIAPGAARVADGLAPLSEERVYAGRGAPDATPEVSAAITSGRFHEHYLERATYTEMLFNRASLVVFTGQNPNPDDPTRDLSIDQIQYLTIDELIAAADKPADIGDSVITMLHNHLNRVGFLPDPAGLLHDSATARRHRPEGLPEYPATTVTVLQQGMHLHAAATVAVPLQSLPPVYLLSGTMLSAAVMHGEVTDISVIAPPYNVALAELDTELETNPLSTAYISQLISNNFYPDASVDEHLFGIPPLADSMPGDVLRGDFVPLPLRVVNEGRFPVSVANAAAVALTVILAEPLYVQIRETARLADSIQFAGTPPTDTAAQDIINRAPPYAAEVLLPAGTFLQIPPAHLSVGLVAAQLPVNYRFLGDYNITAGFANMETTPDRPVRLVAASGMEAAFATAQLTLTVAAGTKLQAGAFGLLPFDSVSTAYDASVTTLVKPADNLSGLIIPQGNSPAFTRTGTALTLYLLDSDTTLMPYPPPGQPSTRTTTALPSPLLIGRQTEFVIPANAQIIYPLNTPILLGDQFLIPAQSRIHLPKNSVVTVRIPPPPATTITLTITFPSGAQLTLDGVTVTATTTVGVTLYHGGVAILGDNRPLVASGQSDIEDFFSIETMDGWLEQQLSLNLATGNYDPVGFPTFLTGARIIHPFSGRRLAADATIPMTTNDTIHSATRLRAQFAPQPRTFFNIYEEELVMSITTTVTVRISTAYENPITTTIALGTLYAVTSGYTPTTIQFDPPLTLTVGENTEFYFPPDNSITFDLTNFAGSDIQLDVALPISTRIFDLELFDTLLHATDARPDEWWLRHPATLSLAHTTTTITIVTLTPPTIPESIAPATITITTTITLYNTLMAYPEADVALRPGLGGQFTIPPGSAIDILNATIYHQTGLQNYQRIPSDMQIVSDDDTYLYIVNDITLQVLDEQFLRMRDEITGSVTAAQTHPEGLRTEIVQTDPNLTTTLSTHIAVETTPTATTTISISTREISVPANSFITYPRGRPLPIEQVDNAVTGTLLLPESAVLVVPATNALVTIIQHSVEITPPTTTTLTTTLTSPLYMQLSDGTGGRVGIPKITITITPSNTITMTNNIIAYTPGNRYLTEQVARRHNKEEVYIPLPKHARVDIFGNVVSRTDSGFYEEFAPAALADSYGDSPIFYATAPKCRRYVARASGTNDANCAQGTGEGLAFTLQQGEEYVLQEDYTATVGVLITTARGDLQVQIQSRELGAVPTLTATVSAVLVQATTGMVSFLAASAPVVSYGDMLIITPAITVASISTRVYFGVDSFSATFAHPDQYHYADIAGALTVQVGGYNAPPYSGALATLHITSSVALTLGVGAKLRHDLRPGDHIFGKESEAVFTSSSETLTVALDGYVVAGSISTPAAATVSTIIEVGELLADASRVDALGNLRLAVEPGDRVATQASDRIDFAGYEAVHAASPVLTIAANTPLKLNPGYLWQGYLPPGSELQFSRDNDRFNFYHRHDSRHPDRPFADGSTGTFKWPRPLLNLRVQSTVAQMNSFGSGTERPETLDGSAGILPPIETGVSYGFCEDFSCSRNPLTVSTAPEQGIVVGIPQDDAPGTQRRVTITTTISTVTITGFDDLVVRIYDPSANAGNRYTLQTVSWESQRVSATLANAWGISRFHSLLPDDDEDKSYLENYSDRDLWWGRQVFPSPTANATFLDASEYGYDKASVQQEDGMLFINHPSGTTSTAVFVHPQIQLATDRVGLPAALYEHDVFHSRYNLTPVAHTIRLADWVSGALDAKNTSAVSRPLETPVLDIAAYSTVTVTTTTATVYATVTLQTIFATALVTQTIIPDAVVASHQYTLSTSGVPLAAHSFPMGEIVRTAAALATYTVTVSYIHDDLLAVHTLFAMVTLTNPIPNVTITLGNPYYRPPNRGGVLTPAEYAMLTADLTAQGRNIATLNNEQSLSWPIGNTLWFYNELTNTIAFASNLTGSGSWIAPPTYAVLTDSTNSVTSAITVVSGVFASLSLTLPVTTYPLSVTFALPTTTTLASWVAYNSSSAATITTSVGMAFYLDRAFNHGDDAPLAMSRIRAGGTIGRTEDDPRGIISRVRTPADYERLFLTITINPADSIVRLAGPGAFVPPFGARTTLAAAGVYAERSRFISTIFDNPTLTTYYPRIRSDYYAKTGGCAAGSDCAISFFTTDWHSILNGIVAFESISVYAASRNTATAAISITLANEIRLLVPEPVVSLSVTLTSGISLTAFYSGSMLFPEVGIAYPAQRITGAVAPGVVDDWALDLLNHEAVAAVDVGPAMGHRPLFYANDSRDNMRDTRIVSGHFNMAPTQTYHVSVTAGGATVTTTLFIEPVAFWNGWVSNFAIPDRSLPHPAGLNDSTNVGLPGTTVSVRDFVWEVVNYDGTWHRGGLLDERGLHLMTTYHRGDFGLFYSNRAGATVTTTDGTNTYTVNFGDGQPIFSSNYTTNITTPTGWRFDDVFTLPIRNQDAKLGNPQSYRWMYPAADMPGGMASVLIGAHITSSMTGINRPRFEPTYLNFHPSGTEFNALRLLHRININGFDDVRVRGNGIATTADPDFPYPHSREQYFQFPPGSEAYIVNADANSWLSAHPMLARYYAGSRVILESSLAAATATLTIAAENDGIRKMDVSERYVSHYRRSENDPIFHILGNTPVHTNVWIRTLHESVLRNRTTGETIPLPPNVLFNPLLGTYLYLDEGLIGGALQRDYAIDLTLASRTRATVHSTLVVAPPAVVIPAGSRMVVGEGGAQLRNVQAAVIFGNEPLAVAYCPSGSLQADGMSGRNIRINQLTEGVDGHNDYPVDIDSNHPCLWIDEPENLDGDRQYLYRSRRRYLPHVAANYPARPPSNDRTHTLGGTLTLN